MNTISCMVFNFFRLVCACFLVYLSLNTGFAQSLTWLGTLGGNRSQANGVSSDGSVVVGEAYTVSWSHAFRWENGVMQDLGTLGGGHSVANGVSSDGSVVVGNAKNGSNLDRAFRWENGVMQDLGTLGGNQSESRGVSSNGSVVAGIAYNSSNQYRAFRWENGVMQDLGTLGGNTSGAIGVSSDGSVVVGGTSDSLGYVRAFRWENGVMQDLGSLGGGFSSAYGVSADGSVVIGDSYPAGGGPYAFRWEIGLMQNLGTLGGDNSKGLGVSSDGSVVVGYAKNISNDTRAFRWTAAGGMEDLSQTYAPLLGNGSYFIYASAISPDGRFIVGHGYNAATGQVEGYLLETTPDILTPKPYSKWIAGETDTIKWAETGWLSVNIKCVINFETPIESEIVLMQGFPVVDPEFAWEIPDTILSFRSKIIVENANNPTEKIESDIFRIKPYVLTRVESDSTYYAYKKSRDQWGFSNTQADMWPPAWYSQFDYTGEDPFTGSQYSQWQGNFVFPSSNSAEHPDWISFVNTFGTDACYTNLFLKIYSPTALVKWESIKDFWGGSCFGIAGINALAFSFKDQFLTTYPDFPNFDEPILVFSNNSTKKIANQVFTHQHGNPSKANDGISWNIKTPNQTVNELKQILLQDNSEARSITIYNNSGSGGHTILPYGLKRDDVLNNLYYIQVYDNSNPNSNNPITVDTTQNGSNGNWNTSDWPGWGGNFNLYLELAADTYLTPATLTKINSVQSPFILGGDVVEINKPSHSSIRIIDEQGNVSGFYNNSVFSEIPGSIARMIKNGGETPPYGYSLPTENYSIILNEFTQDTLEVFLFSGNKSFSYERSGATQTQTDKLFFDGGISAVNPDAQLKTVKLLTLINETTQEKLTVIRSIELVQNDSVKIENPDSNKVKLISYGSAKNYDIELNYATENGIGRFGDFNVSLSANTSHTFLPDWENVAISDLLVLVDVGNDGTIDDTLAVENQLSSSTNFQLSVAVNDGWNMVSTPGLHPLNQGVSTWWSQKDPSANVFKYSNGYQAISTTIPGEGYWMKHLGSNVYETGDEWPAGGIQTVSHDPISGASGWNLIGGYELSIPTANVTTNPPGLQNGPIYNYSGGYQIATTLDPGYGYWMKLTDAGQIIIPETLAKGVKPTEWFSDDWGRIVLTDASGINYTLYAVKGASDLSQYELPPAPPVGMFDVRFGSDRIVEEIMDSQKEIYLSGITLPLIVRVEGMDISLMDETGNRIDVILKSGNSVTIVDPTINKLIVHGKKSSMEYSLEQNYPNPFNPVTTIKYSLANKDMVVLKVYDVLGNEVSSLVNEEKHPGFYEVKFDASQLASGIYFYKLQAGGFVETKKMILIK